MWNLVVVKYWKLRNRNQGESFFNLNVLQDQDEANRNVFSINLREPFLLIAALVVILKVVFMGRRANIYCDDMWRPRLCGQLKTFAHRISVFPSVTYNSVFLIFSFSDCLIALTAKLSRWMFCSLVFVWWKMFDLLLHPADNWRFDHLRLENGLRCVLQPGNSGGLKWYCRNILSV